MIARPAALTRRGVILAGALTPIGVLTACASDRGLPGSASGSGQADGSSSGQDSLEPSTLAAGEDALISRYDAVLAAFPQNPQAALLQSIREHHVRHRQALDPSGGEGAVAEAPSTAATLDAALTELAAAERSASRRRVRECVDSTDPEQARVLALVAAAEAAHVPALRAAQAP